MLSCLSYAYVCMVAIMITIIDVNRRAVNYGNSLYYDNF